MKNILAFLIVGLGFLCSCESRDGDWDSMVWESNDVSNINKNKNKMNVTFFPNEEYQIRNISIGITAGDIFNSFFFKQKGKDN